MWGHDVTRNMVAAVTDLPETFMPGRRRAGSDVIDAKAGSNVSWVAKLGSQSYGNPTLAGGRVFVGTNNNAPRDARMTGDRGCVYCLDIANGELLWQLCIPKLGNGKVSDWEYLGICSSPAVDGDRVYIVTNRCEVMCLDAKGMADGNAAPFVDEAQYQAGPGRPPIPTHEHSADIVWVTNLIDTCGVFPHNITSCSVLVIGDQIWTATSNGVDYSHTEMLAPNAPCLVVLDKHTGKVIGEEATGLGRRTLHCNWSSPALLQTADARLVLFGGGDGALYAFPSTVTPKDDGPAALVEAWRFDCNPREYRFAPDGTRRKYATSNGPSEILATPVAYRGRAYVAIGQDPEHGDGLGNLCCVGADGKEVWQHRIRRSISTVSLRDDLLFVADYAGFVSCLDADTGAAHWRYDTKAHIWGSTLVADGRVFVGTDDGTLVVLRASKDDPKATAKELDFGAPIYSTPIAVDGVLYVATQTHLFAFRKEKK